MQGGAQCAVLHSDPALISTLAWSAGLRCLVVLDDVWNSDHGEQLAFIDASSITSKLMVTSRFSKLLEPCRVMMLGLLDDDEAKELLLETSCIGRTDHNIAAIDQITPMCGNLPLLLTTVRVLLYAAEQ